MTRKQYTKEFKLESLKLAEKIGVPQAAADLEIGQSLLYRWRKAAENEGKDAFRGHGRLTERDEELRRWTCKRPRLFNELCVGTGHPTTHRIHLTRSLLQKPLAEASDIPRRRWVRSLEKLGFKYHEYDELSGKLTSYRGQ